MTRTITLKELRLLKHMSRNKVYQITDISPQRINLLESIDDDPNRNLFDSISYREALILSSLYGIATSGLFFDSMNHIYELQSYYLNEGEKYSK